MCEYLLLSESAIYSNSPIFIVASQMHGRCFQAKIKLNI